MISAQWRIEYITYNNPEFSCAMWAEDEAYANRIADGLRKLKHVSHIEIVPPSEDNLVQAHAMDPQ